MDSYVQEKPYFANVTKEDTYFKEVQIATEWDIIDASQIIDVNKCITWKEALLSLVNAGNFISADSTDDEKIDCAIKNLIPL